MSEFGLKDSGAREEFDSGMVRDTAEEKIDYLLLRDGPMYERWAVHLTKGARKYDKSNWLKANGEAELRRFRESAARHFEQWLRGDRDEDHAAAVFFNLNGAEYVLSQLEEAEEVEQDDPIRSIREFNDRLRLPVPQHPDV